MPHRDYSVAIDSRIEFYSNRIEIISPGGLPLGMLKEEYIDGKLSNPRNRKLADIFLRIKIIEKLATGIRRIKEQYLYQEVKPSFLVSENAIVIVLPHVIESSNREIFQPGETGRYHFVRFRLVSTDVKTITTSLKLFFWDNGSTYNASVNIN